MALIGAQTNLNVTVLIDYQKKDQQNIENLYKKKLLRKKHVRAPMPTKCFSANEADIEDMFNPEFYIMLVNRTFKSSVTGLARFTR